MDQNTQISSAEEELKNFGNFLEKHDQLLKQLLGKSLNNTKLKPQLDKFNQPIKVNYDSNQENLPLLKLIDSDRLLNKSILTFAYLCNEIEEIVIAAKSMQMKFLYIDEDLCTLESNGDDINQIPDKNESESNNQQYLHKMSCSLDFLCNIQFLVQRCILLASNVLHQCGAFLAFENQVFEFKFFNVFDSLGSILFHLLVFDEILSSSNFHRFWSSYKKTVEKISRNSDKLDFCTKAEIVGLINCLNELEFLFSGSIFQSFLDSTFMIKEKIGPKSLSQLGSQFQEYLRMKLNKIEKLPTDLCDFSETQILVQMNALCVLCHDFFGQFDLKFLKMIQESNNKHMGITLIGNIVWTPGEFLRKHAETLVRPYEKSLNDTTKQRQIYLDNRVQNLQRDCKLYCSQISLWIINVKTSLKSATSELKVEQFKEHANMLLQGLQYSGQLSYIIKAVINMHVLQQTAMTKNTLLSVCKFIEMLKMIQLVFQSDVESIAKTISCIVQYLQYKALQIILFAKKKITSTTMHDRNVDALAALKICEKCLQGPATRTRILVACLAVNATNSAGRTLPIDQYDRFTSIIHRIELLATFQENLKQLCDTSFIYWHQSLLSAYLKQIIEKKMDFNSFQFLVKSSNDCGRSLDMLKLGNIKLADMLKKSNFESFKTEITSNLCAQIETFLRLEVHSSLQLEKMNPFEQNINDYRDLINICPIELNGQYLILQDHVENYLSNMFYNLTTISLHDWKTYEEMRQLGNYRLNLNPIEDYLPNQTIEQGIDVLEIMRNIHIFVSKYVYNMNTQIFVEQKSSNKHLDTIGIRHIANSLRTHGTGIINTTVNFTYQFLRQKFYTFSQFLYDEQIKSRLMKELRALAENKQNSRKLYPYERADAFNKDIRKLGLSEDGKTYMDLFRTVITHVGNAMGYIRLVRSGSIHANYSASIFLPKFDENLKFVDYAKKSQLNDVTISAAENLETNIRNLSESFSDGTDYFKILVEAFQPFFSNPNNIHLKNVYLIIPALTLNYVEYILNAKDKIHKKDKQEAVLFDDGFTVGLAYILKLLNQYSEFNSLHWFENVTERFEAERKKINLMRNEINSNVAGRKDENEKLQQTLALTEKRITTHQMEYNLLYYNLCSAKIFFH
ncbi:WASH complex subunit 4 [Episyrphus balteatus]|uniref:WASH complex subunit 4 n=1 Tax=Episyrphus balteatus TaxID=286459 RepID=UPI0024860ADC|nr:WASH complex subunit 4 [Episyrphus balteatus]